MYVHGKVETVHLASVIRQQTLWTMIRRPLGQGRQARAIQMTNLIRQNQQRLIVRTFCGVGF
jgi:hypothetical protein